MMNIESGVEIKMLIEKGLRFWLFTLSTYNGDDFNNCIMLDTSFVQKGTFGKLRSYVLCYKLWNNLYFSLNSRR